MKEVNIYTAVSCTKKTGEGGLGYVLEFTTEKGKATATKVEHFYGTENQGHIIAVLHEVEFKVKELHEYYNWLKFETEKERNEVKWKYQEQ